MVVDISKYLLLFSEVEIQAPCIMFLKHVLYAILQLHPQESRIDLCERRGTCAAEELANFVAAKVKSLLKVIQPLKCPVISELFRSGSSKE